EGRGGPAARVSPPARFRASLSSAAGRRRPRRGTGRACADPRDYRCGTLGKAAWWTRLLTGLYFGAAKVGIRRQGLKELTGRRAGYIFLKQKCAIRTAWGGWHDLDLQGPFFSGRGRNPCRPGHGA